MAWLVDLCSVWDLTPRTHDRPWCEAECLLHLATDTNKRQRSLTQSQVVPACHIWTGARIMQVGIFDQQSFIFHCLTEPVLKPQNLAPQFIHVVVVHCCFIVITWQQHSALIRRLTMCNIKNSNLYVLPTITSIFGDIFQMTIKITQWPSMSFLSEGQT